MTRTRHGIVLLALAAILLRGFLPMGWMPDAQGGFTICSVDGTHRTAPSDQPVKPDHSDSICPFAAAAHLAPPILAALALPVRSADTLQQPALPSTIASSRAWHNPQSPRAPPFSA
jgi:hypothetical protein